MSDSYRVPINLAEKADKLLGQFPTDSWHFSTKDFLLTNQESTWIIAFSGGADSLLALLLVYSAFPEMRDKMIVAHFNHNLRGKESDKDAIFTEEISSRLQLELKLGSAKSIHKTDEATLREQRRNFLKDVMKEARGEVLIQGHNLDDIAETFLWRIARGVGVEGLCAPKPVQKFGHFNFVRPLLSIPRKSIRQSLEKVDIQWREDSSNKDTKYLRNRIRNNTLAQWKIDSDRNLLKGVERTRDLLEEQDHALEQWAKEILKKSSQSKQLRVDVLKHYPRGLIRKVMILWLVNDMNLSSVHQYHIDEILNLLGQEKDFKIDLSDSFTLASNGNIFFKQKKTRKAIQWNLCSLPFNFRVYLPDKYFLTAKKMKLDTELLNMITSGRVDQFQNAYISGENVGTGLFLRKRIKGDRFRPIGAPGSKKVKDWMIDRHWSPEKKVRTPIVVNNSNQILWIPGFPPSGNSAVNSSQSAVIRLTYHKTPTIY